MADKSPLAAGHAIEGFMHKRVRKAVFPVAGLGTRFLPATKAMPKEMLPIVDKPLIHYAVEEAKAAGIEEFFFVTSRGKSAIDDHFDRAIGHGLHGRAVRDAEIGAVVSWRVESAGHGRRIGGRRPETGRVAR